LKEIIDKMTPVLTVIMTLIKKGGEIGNINIEGDN